MIGKTLGPYEIISAIGSGGMGEVWKARDLRLGRIVAIKKVKEQHSERFKQEARSIAALNHPNICQIHDIGDDYLVLEYVEGKPLSRPLPEEEAVRLAIQIATALEAAHRKGIIHRDLKPSNIMVTDEGIVKLLDFGLAKLYEQDTSISNLPTADFPETQAGTILGTVAYMSPEQAQGQLADGRSDIFSFGLVLFEMLSGKRAFTGESPIATAMAVVKDEPLPLQTSPQLEKIVKRCLEKNPLERYQTMAEVKAALEKAIKKGESVASGESQPSIAVLPFVNMSGDKEQEYFSDGLAEEIINALTKIPGLKVIARTSAFAFKGKEQDITRIAEALRVSNILEGSVRKSGNRIRVTAQLITASDGSHLWSERYDREMTDAFEIQDEICQAIIDKLRVELSSDSFSISSHIKNMEAHNLYLQGRYLLYKGVLESMLKSKEHFDQAITVDPKYALAWFGLADYYYLMGFMGFMLPKEASAQCKRAAQKALEINERLPEAHASLGLIWASEFAWKEAEKEFRKALEYGPKSEDVRKYYSLFYLVPMGSLDEAVAVAIKMLELDPLSLWVQWYLGYLYYLMHQWDRAIEQFNQTLELDPHYYLPYQWKGFTYLQAGKLSEGIQTCETAAQIVGQSPWALSYRGIAYAQAGRTDEVGKILEELQKLAQQSYISPTIFAWIYSSLGDTEKGLEWFEKAMNDRDIFILHGPVLPIYDPLRSHPRYKALLRKMNLEP